MTAKKGAATKIIIGVLLVVIVCMGAYIVHLTGAEKEPSDPTDVPVADEVVTPVTPSAVETEPVVTPETDADTTATVETKTGFTLEADVVYAIEDAPMWSNYNTGSENVGTLSFGDCETRLGQGYGEADGWSRFMLTPGEHVYIESKYLSTEKPKTEGSKSTDKE